MQRAGCRELDVAIWAHAHGAEQWADYHFGQGGGADCAGQQLHGAYVQLAVVGECFIHTCGAGYTWMSCLTKSGSCARPHRIDQNGGTGARVGHYRLGGGQGGCGGDCAAKEADDT
jgi:hypothetical protein